MSLRYPGGLITKSPTAPTTSAAKGVWTLEQALQYIKAGTWPLSALGDPYFQYNTMLLPGQGTNGAQNNTFLDSGTANSGVGFPLNRSGNTTQGTFTPFSQADGYWSTYFGGSSSSYVSAPYNASQFAFSTNNFTMECFVQFNGFVNDGKFLIQYDGSSYWQLNYSTSTGINFINNGTVIAAQGNTAGWVVGTWYHIALVRNGSSFYIYRDGVVVASGTSSASINNNASALTIAGNPNAGGLSLNGFMSNVRILNGTPLYSGSSTTTANFTVPTSPLTTTSGGASNCVLLTLQNNRFVDNSSFGSALTTANSPAINPFQPFGAPTVAYSASTIGGSGYFDGTSDYLTATANNAFNFGTGEFTVEGWIYPVAAGTMGIWANGPASAGSFGIAINSSGKLQMDYYGGTSLAGATNVPVNAWSYFAFVRTGSTLNIYLNGVRDATTTTSSNNSTNDFALGLGWTNITTGGTNGYISGFRISDAFARYTGTTMTVPTAPTVNDGNTTVLCNFTNAGIIDNAQKNDLETVGTSQISTSQYKWGVSSIYFNNGETNPLVVPNNQNFNLSSGDFTIESWVYVVSNRTFNYIISKGGSNTREWAISVGPSDIRFYWSTNGLSTGDSTVTASAAVPLSTWSHVAVIRTANTIKIFLNGNQVGSGAFTSMYSGTSPLYVGRFMDFTGISHDLNGYLADLRITKGYARYPYNFTAPTAAFPLFWQAAATPSADPYFEYTTLLLPGNQPSGVTDTSNNVFKDSSANNFTITRNPASGPNAPTQGTFTPFSQTGWGNFFDGTGDYLTVASSADFNIFGGDMTVECWFYSTADSLGTRSEHLFAFVQDSTNRESLYFNGTTLTFWTSSGAGNGPRITYANTPQNQWIHVAVAKSGSTFTMYINGVSVGTSTTTQYSTSNQSLQIGTYNSAGAGPDSFTGYISNVRVVKGTAVYTANFIPSTTPLTSVTNTVLLTCQSNRFVDTNTQTTAKTVTPSGDTSVQAFSPFNPTAAYSASTVGGSGYFDGTGDFLSVANNAAFNFGSGAFTIEFWYYPTTLSGTQCLVTNYGGSTTGFVIQMGGSTPGSGRIDAGFSGDGADITSTNAVRLNSWNHIAISGTPGATGIKLFINGAQEGSTYTGATSLDTSSTLLIGEVASTNRLFGYLCGLRLVKGGALYTATFTPPTSPPTTTVSSGTVSLLTNFTNGAIIDNTAKHDLETVGGAAISTTQSKFGGSSMYFDGVDDNAIIPYNPIFSIGTADFTVEGWFYFSNLSTTARALIALGDGANGGGPYNAWTLRYLGSEGSNQLEFYRYDGTGYNYTTSGLTLSASTWYHIAVARYSGVLKIFVNGISYYSNTATTNFGAINTNPLRIALQYYGPSPGYGGPRYWNGYINDLRITKGIARYTTNFTPPTTAFLTL